MYMRKVCRISSADSATTPVKGKGTPILRVGRSSPPVVEPTVVEPGAVEPAVVDPTVVEPPPESSPAHAATNPVTRKSANHLRFVAIRPPPVESR
jgi:hypothetical protein